MHEKKPEKQNKKKNKKKTRTHTTAAVLKSEAQWEKLRKCFPKQKDPRPKVHNAKSKGGPSGRPKRVYSRGGGCRIDAKKKGKVLEFSWGNKR